MEECILKLEEKQAEYLDQLMNLHSQGIISRKTAKPFDQAIAKIAVGLKILNAMYQKQPITHEEHAFLLSVLRENDVQISKVKSYQLVNSQHSHCFFYTPSPEINSADLLSETAPDVETDTCG